MVCPSCGGINLYRSHARSAREKTVRLLLPVRFFRCHECGWRGARPTIRWRSAEHMVASLLLIVFAGVFLAALVGVMMYLVLFGAV